MWFEIWHYPSVDTDGTLIDSLEAPDAEEAFFLTDLLPAEVYEWDYDRDEAQQAGTYSNPENPDELWIARPGKQPEIGPVEVSIEHRQLLARIARAIVARGTVMRPKGEPCSAQEVLTDILNLIEEGIDRPGSWEAAVIASFWGDLYIEPSPAEPIGGWPTGDLVASPPTA